MDINAQKKFDDATNKQKEMYEMKYNDDLSLSEIASELGKTRQGVSESINFLLLFI